jgi:hypothetical protein
MKEKKSKLSKVLEIERRLDISKETREYLETMNEDTLDLILAWLIEEFCKIDDIVLEQFSSNEKYKKCYPTTVGKLWKQEIDKVPVLQSMKIDMIKISRKYFDDHVRVRNFIASDPYDNYSKEKYENYYHTAKEYIAEANYSLSRSVISEALTKIAKISEHRRRVEVNVAMNKFGI